MEILSLIVQEYPFLEMSEFSVGLLSQALALKSVSICVITLYSRPSMAQTPLKP